MHNYNHSEKAIEKSLILRSLIWPAIFVAVIWLVKVVETLTDTSFAQYGMKPKEWRGLIGIFTYPFLHKDFSHLSSNSLPLLFLGAALFYFYRKTSFIIFIQLFIISGFWLWLLGEYSSIHIGASGLVYGLTAFHITAGLIKKNKNLLAFALLVLFLYGSMVWGLFPDFFPKQKISWEGHLMGMLAGIALAWYHRDKGPQRDRYQWEWDELEEDDEDDDSDIKPDVSTGTYFYSNTTAIDPDKNTNTDTDPHSNQ